MLNRTINRCRSKQILLLSNYRSELIVIECNERKEGSRLQAIEALKYTCLEAPYYLKLICDLC